MCYKCAYFCPLAVEGTCACQLCPVDFSPMRRAPYAPFSACPQTPPSRWHCKVKYCLCFRPQSSLDILRSSQVWKRFMYLLTVLFHDLGAGRDTSKTRLSLKKVFSEYTMHNRTAEASAKHKSPDHFNFKRTRMVTTFSHCLLNKGQYFAPASVYLGNSLSSLNPK